MIYPVRELIFPKPARSLLVRPSSSPSNPNFWSDPRLYQIASLAGLLLFGVWCLDFEIGAAQATITLLGALVTQFLATKLTHVSRFEWKSALISGLSLCLLLRTNSLWLAAVGAGAAVGSKFLLRWRGKHLFNPTNFALVVPARVRGRLRLGFSRAVGQRGVFRVCCSFCLGGLVVGQTGRADVALSFLAFYLGLLFARSAWLGEPMAIPLHRMQNGALLIFAFFMISDPRTTPDSRAGRIVFALLVAAGAWYVQYRLYRTNGLLWSLALGALLVPILDRLLPGRRHLWRPLHSSSANLDPELNLACIHENTDAPSDCAGVPAGARP